MRLNKRIFYFSTGISIITLIVSCILNFMIEETKVNVFIVNICMNIFAGSIVLIVTSLFDYFIQKRDLLEQIYQEGNKFFRMFNQIKYFDDDKCDFKIFMARNESLKDTTLAAQKRYYNSYVEIIEKKKKEEILEIMDSYIKIAEYDYTEFWNLYKEIDFIFDFRKKKRKFLYNNFFSYIHKMVNEIQSEVFHFKIYKESKNGNYLVNSNKIKELQKKIFYTEMIKNDEEFKCKEKYSGYRLYQIKTSFENETEEIIINDFAFNIDKIRNIIYDITYTRKLKAKNKDKVLDMKDRLE